ncbi:hypothetical protein BYT27DRAFT_7342798 [Phlegmacium glaucopus]|nr:hypothetical protein BYT27DRAFT_7342798 [Phlegmacium glaucopus]
MCRRHLTVIFIFLLRNLHPDLQKEVKGIINGPENVAPVPAGVNQRPVVKHGMAGEALKPAMDIPYSATELLGRLKNSTKRSKISPTTGSSSLTNRLARKQGHHFKVASNTGSVKASPRRKSIVVGKRAKMTVMPIRSSARLAAIGANGEDKGKK